ncbi:hypothetical protein [Streptomyces sp. ISL-94]|uniref:hypothetical protein n=1 Tax=Streptomyces sp. ISL-94 TaxID=2819190 RepID=UPI001BE5438C|nr:hypothetical protein [Streptomyces sp. ISL-94]MBT2481510.1 hypothetical protein [Streptomyces sp. ISL-94]
MVTAWPRSGGRPIRPSAGRLVILALALLILGFLCPHNSEPGSPTSASPVAAGAPAGEDHHGPSHDCAPLSPQPAAAHDAATPRTAASAALRVKSALPGRSPALAADQGRSACPAPAHPVVRAVLQM